MSRQLLGEDIGEQSLGETAAVELDAGRPPDRALVQIHLDGSPPLRGAGARRPAGRRQPQGDRQGQGLRELARVAGGLDLIDQGCVDEAAAQRAGDRHDVCEKRHQRAHRHHAADVAVQAREFAVR